MFKDYRPDTEVLLAKCFEFDWENTKLPKIVKSQEDRADLKKYLSTVYKYIREVYKYYAAVNPAGQIFSIGTNAFSDIITNCEGALDQRTLKISDLDLEFVATNAGSRGQRNPERQLVRYQLMEALVRVSMTKYYKTGVCKTITDAVETMFIDHLIPYF